MLRREGERVILTSYFFILDYGEMPMASAQDYYDASRRAVTSGRNRPIQDLSSGYYYEHPHQSVRSMHPLLTSALSSRRHYNSRYNYSNEHYQQQQPSARFNPKRSSKRGGLSAVSTRPQKSQVNNGSNNNNNSHPRHHSVSDNDQKEGEEWETASESSTNMRTGHHDNNGSGHQPTNDNGSNHRGRTPPKKSFSSQRYSRHVSSHRNLRFAF